MIEVQADRYHGDQVEDHNGQAPESGGHVVVGIALDEIRMGRPDGEVEDVIDQKQQNQGTAPSNGARGPGRHLGIASRGIPRGTCLLPAVRQLYGDLVTFVRLGSRLTRA